MSYAWISSLATKISGLATDHGLDLRSPCTDQLDCERNAEMGFTLPKIDASREMRLVRLSRRGLDSVVEARYRVDSLEGIKTEQQDYIALSYTWGCALEEADVREIRVHGQRFWVRTNLWFFLREALSLLLRALFYIDAMCIDQCNIAERESQVKIMSKVYSKAAKVVVWLGMPDSDDEIAALRVLCAKADWSLRAENDHEQGLVDKGLEYISCRPYWSRLWVVQEMLLAAQLEFICGGIRISWNQVATLQPERLEFMYMAQGSDEYVDTVVRGQGLKKPSGFLRLVEQKLDHERCQRKLGLGHEH